MIGFIIILTFITFTKQIQNSTDLISQEIINLEIYIQLQEQKLDKLKQLREAFIDENKTLPQINEFYINQILHSSQSQTQQINKVDSQQERSFVNRILKKFSFTINERIIFSESIQTFSYRTSSDTQSQTMIVVLTDSGSIQLYDTTGNLLNITKTDQKSIKFFAAGNSAGDPVLITFGDDEVFIHRIESKRNNQTADRTVPKNSIYTKVEQSFILQEPIQNVTDFQQFSVRGQKFLVFSDSQGQAQQSQFKHKIKSVYHRNGTYIGKKQLSSAGILGFQKSFPNLLFATNSVIGYFSPNTLEQTQPFCEPLPYKIIQVLGDVQSNSIAYALTENGEIYIYEVKSSEQQCKIKQRLSHHQIPKIISNQTHQIVSLRYFLLLLDRQSKQVIVFNTSEVLSDEIQKDDPIIVNFLGNNDGSQVFVTTSKGFQNSHYLLIQENKETQSDLTYYEILLPSKKDNDYLQNFRFPIIIIALVLAFGYQIWSRGSKKSKKGNNVEKDMEDFVNSNLGSTSKKNITATPDAQKRVEMLREQIDSIDKKTRQYQNQIQEIGDNSKNSRSNAMAKKYN